MKKHSFFFPIFFLILSALACNFDSSLITGQMPPATSAPVIATPASTQEEETVSTEEVAGTEEVAETEEVVETEEVSVLTPTEENDGKLDPCTLLTAKQAESILGEPVSPAEVKNGSCVYSNAKDKLFMINIAAAQDKDAVGILQGQALLLMFTGNPVSDELKNTLKILSDNLDYKGFFTQLAAAAKGSPVMTAKLFTGGGNDLVYWAWISAPPRRQGAFVAVRKNTLININVVLADSADGNALVKSLNSLAGEAFARLPEKFSSSQKDATITTESLGAENVTITVVPETPVPAAQSNPTPVPTGIAPPVLVSPADGTTFDIYPRTTTLEWKPVLGATRYLVDIMACSSSNTSNCFSHPMIEQSSRETVETSYTFNFIGAQPGKWRVTAIGADGKLGIPSSWWTFTYSK